MGLDFFDETPADSATPATAAAPTVPATSSPLFAPETPVAAPVPQRDPLPHYGKGRLVREVTTDGTKGRIGLVLAAGGLEPDAQGDRPAVVVGWFESVSHPIVTDQVEAIDS